MTKMRKALYLVFLVTMSVVVCHLFEWRWLKSCTSEALVRVALACKLDAARIGWDLVEWQGNSIRLRTACTFVDVFFGAVPILWTKRLGLVKNAGRVAAFAALLFPFNILRLSLGFWLYAKGVPWIVAHDIFSGFAYFGVWVMLSKVSITAMTWRSNESFAADILMT
jgi:hypothetical protein